MSETDTSPAEWLKNQIRRVETEEETLLIIPRRDDGSHYELTSLYEDQLEVACVVLNTLHEFLTIEDLRNFKPLRIIVNGQGGSGKSVVINTIVSVMRRMFGINDVVKVVAPTGTAAYNVNGETFHHLFHMGVHKKEYKCNTMTASARKRLICKFKTLLALIVDERSLVTSKVMGTAESYLSETIFGGGHYRDHSWGGLPILVIAGDDYQLPGIGEGPLTALFSRAGSKMTQIGRSALLECAECVMDLGSSKRMKDSERANKLLLQRLRIGSPNEDDVKKLVSLHLAHQERIHGKAFTNEIKDKAIYLYYRNSKRQDHNLRELARRCSDKHPVAICRARSQGTTRAKGIGAHFEGDLPAASFFCVGSKVALSNRNFHPAWGLHNGACGTVDEIIFESGSNPNEGGLPSYVVVDFPLYNGPIWDEDNPTVRLRMMLQVSYDFTYHVFQLRV